MADSNEMLLPRFAKAGLAPSSEAWAEVDSFDVEMLAEYLLDDGNLTMNGVTFDFNLDGANQDTSLVSPENSEDGNLPPVGENVVTAIPSVTPLPPAAMQVPALFPPQAGIQVNHIGSSIVPAGAESLSNLMQQQQAVETIAKRRRIEMPAQVVAMGGVPDNSLILTGQQLAAAAQAMQQQGRGRKKTQAQIDRRRERNRILARRTRLRKKFFFESLQKEVMELQRENLQLKDIVKVDVGGDEAQKILDECDANDKLPPGVLEACGENANDMDQQDFNLVRSIQRSQHSFLITDPSLQDNPIVFASDDFLKLTGYSREQVLGRNCRFLQGTETSKEKIDLVRRAISMGEDVSVTLVNYTATGTPFWNKLFVAALRDAQNNIVNFIGVIVKVASPEPGDPEHGKLLPGAKMDDDFDDDSDFDDGN